MNATIYRTTDEHGRVVLVTLDRPAEAFELWQHLVDTAHDGAKYDLVVNDSFHAVMTAINEERERDGLPVFGPVTRVPGGAS